MLDTRLAQLMAASMVMSGCAMASNDATSVRPGIGLSLDRVVQFQAPVDIAAPGKPTVPGDDRPTQPEAAASTSPGGGGPSTPGAPTIATVVNRAELPLAGATVTYRGGSATSDETGHVTLPAGANAGPVTVAKDGYKTSVVAGAAETYHLVRNDGRTEPFEARTRLVSGHVTWPTVDGDGQPVSPQGGVVYYQDNLGTVTTPVALNDDGSYAFEVSAAEAGEPLGVVLVLAGEQSGTQNLFGASAPFKPFAGEQPGEVAVAVADRPVTLAAPAAPAELESTTWRLELVVPGLAPVVITDEQPASAPLALPAPNSLPGTLRVRFRALSLDAQRGASATVVPRVDDATGQYGPVGATYLPLPASLSLAATGVVSWAATPGATAYRLSVRNAERKELWEAWAGPGLKFELSPTDRSRWGGGSLAIEAIDAPGLTTRTVASLRQLRVSPWLSETAYRTSYYRLSL